MGKIVPYHELSADTHHCKNFFLPLLLYLQGFYLQNTHHFPLYYERVEEQND